MKVESYRVWLIMLTAIGGALCFVPLFDVLGYEWCLALALAASFAGAQLGAATVVQRRAGQAPSAVTAVDARPGLALARLYGGVVGRLWLLLAVPLVAVLANALRVRNCDLGAGFAWFAMGPLLSAAMGVALGMVCGLVWPWQRARAPVLLAIAGVLGSIGWGVWRFYGAPPIFGYDPFVGYFAGALYDEEVAIGAAFGWARLYQAATAAAALAACALFLDGATLALSWRAGRGRRGPAALLLATALLALGLHHQRAQLGWALDAADVAHALGAEKRTTHAVIHYSPAGPYAKELDADALDVERRWEELTRLFGRAPEPPLHVYFFDNAWQKRALMGAGHTMVAKPWRREVYLQHEGWPQPSLAHEMAHVFAGPFGDRLFGVARRGTAFNVGLVEGLAVAASWSGSPLTPHQTVKILREAHVIDDKTLARVLGPSFFGLNAGQAYNVAGSFCRFLVDTRGADKLLALYGAAGEPDAYRRIYGVGFDALAAEWGRMLDAQEVPAAERDVTVERLKRPSLFGRPCAHALALKRQQAQRAASGGDRRAALAAWQAICADDPGDPQNLADALDAAFAADDRETVRTLAARLAKAPGANQVLRGKAESTLGDVALLSGDVDGARAAYERAAKLPMDEGTARLNTVKRLVCRWPAGPSRAMVAQLLAAPASTRDGAIDLMNLRALVERDPGRALYRYLLARQLFARDRFGEVVDVLSRLPDEALPDARFDREQARILGASRYRLGDYDGADAEFARIESDREAGEGLRREASDWRARCVFAKGQLPKP